MSDLAGKILAGRYSIDALIGRGGMADVYRGTDTMLHRPVAIKVLTERDGAERDRFLREARSMAKLNHPNVVGVYDAGQTDDVSFIVMELVDGRVLSAVPPAELTVRTAVRAYVAILEALAYAHAMGVIHRDVKPTNVMILPNGTVKVMDFGLARNASDMSTASSAGEIVGTIAYLPPERFLGKSADARGDLYSVGVMLYETFTGTLPFKSDNDDIVAVIFGHVNEPPAPPRTINRGVPPEIEKIILKLLEKDPDKRYASADEVVAELNALLTGVPATAPASGAAERSGAAPSSSQSDARDVLAKTFGRSRPLDVGYAETLAGMLAARKRDYSEATRAYRAALAAFTEAGNDLEGAKTALKYATMILQKSAEGTAESRELSEAVETLTGALPSFRGRSMIAELTEGEKLLYALQRQLIRTR